ncbi:MAG: sigma 54-interacting transcriptional regulator [Nitrospina sp.]|jgi:PAS domain S-box-containing protein|nr:sigma 54-interacting transcriptional regulator [Nitrospina sp.]MBT6718907.1 sigma 54-interacting transcriptional regulator [Nitrospina sp.]
MGKDIKKERSLELAQFTIQRSADVIIFNDSEGVILKANDSACKRLGYSEDELIGLTIQDIDPDSNKKTWKKFWKDLRKDRNVSFEARHQTRKGAIIPVDVSVNFVEFDGKEYAVGFGRDISARKKMEEEKACAFDEIQRLRKQLELENEYLNEEVGELQSFGGIIGQSPSLQTILKQIDMVATTDANVLISGESGTGKELIANEIHKRSPRSKRPLIRVNCASVPRELYESEFFGHVKGAFTGAIKDRVGRFELADEGTLFLDEVGEIPLDLQSKLLRVLQEGTFERVGDEKTQKSNVRVIAATNRNLKNEVAKGNFREDLFYRLNVFPLEVSPLRERKIDIPLLAVHFFKRAEKKFNRTGINLSKANLIHMENYSWPGNIRELQNVIERAMIISRSGRLILDLPETPVSKKFLKQKNSSYEIQKPNSISTFAEIKQFEKENILKALNQTKWKIFGIGGAAELLGVPPTTLTTRIQRMGLKDYRTI